MTMWGVRPRMPMAQDMGQATRDGPAHKKACSAQRCSACTARHQDDILMTTIDLL